MAVEMAVLLPVALAMVFVMLNVLSYLANCARFDPLAAEAVRIEAVSPNAGSYGTAARAKAAEKLLSQAFEGHGNVSISVKGSQAIATGGFSDQGVSDSQAVEFSFLPLHEVYTCTLSYRPWGFPQGLFGLELFEVRHQRRLVIDPYRPGVLF
ncbi:MAG: hypothetical protein FWF71_03445 [Actinomycetia bacterium]|nr:hypothetical protein [Actinomycetes bacterium]